MHHWQECKDREERDDLEQWCMLSSLRWVKISKSILNVNMVFVWVWFQDVQEADRPEEGFYIRSGITVVVEKATIKDGTVIWTNNGVIWLRTLLTNDLDWGVFEVLFLGGSSENRDSCDNVFNVNYLRVLLRTKREFKLTNKSDLPINLSFFSWMSVKILISICLWNHIFIRALKNKQLN